MNNKILGNKEFIAPVVRIEEPNTQKVLAELKAAATINKFMELRAATIVDV